MKSRGFVNPIIVPLAMSVILVIVLSVSTYVYWSKYEEQKSQVEDIVAEAVEAAKAAEAEELESQHQEELKKPYETYTAPAEFNAVAVTYPRSWSSYVIAGNSGNLALEGYFHPGTVPNTRGEEKFALRLSLERSDYADEVDDYQNGVERGEIKAEAVTVNQVKGVRLTGAIERELNGVMVILPLRDKVLKLWTESNAYIQDFNQIIIPNLAFDR